MKKFMDDQFLLRSATAQRLFHDYARDLPIIDYHCHLPPADIAANTRFPNITELWLAGDHYKWRAMRANGIDESLITGNAGNWEKFQAWAATVPYTLRNPLYHWTHLELQRYFGIDELLTPASARRIYDACNEQLQSPEFSVRQLLHRMKVELVCTTDDPKDSLEHHRQLAREGFEIPILPAFRPDQAMQVNDPATFNSYVRSIGIASGMEISGIDDYIDALRSRHDYFSAHGCVVADHGLDRICAVDFTREHVVQIFHRIRSGRMLEQAEQDQLRSALLLQFAEWHWEKNWVQQFHLGAMRNNRTRLFREVGPDSGGDSMGDLQQARSLSRFLDRLDERGRLAKTILYNLNPTDNEVFATMSGNFNDGSVPGKMQWGSAWWFMDQRDGMTRQIDTLSNLGLISRFVGMLTDSRSFLSFPRHEYFRRILCDIFGGEIERGELPDDLSWTGRIITDICYNNAKQYFNWKQPGAPAETVTSTAKNASHASTMNSSTTEK